MTITELLSGSKDYATLHGLFIVGPVEFMQATVGAQRDDAQHRLAPVELVDGRYMLGADFLTEVHDTGLYGHIWNKLDKDIFQNCTVLTKDELQPLLPVADEEAFA